MCSILPRTGFSRRFFIRMRQRFTQEFFMSSPLAMSLLTLEISVKHCSALKRSRYCAEDNSERRRAESGLNKNRVRQLRKRLQSGKCCSIHAPCSIQPGFVRCSESHYIYRHAFPCTEFPYFLVQTFSMPIDSKFPSEWGLARVSPKLNILL